MSVRVQVRVVGILEPRPAVTWPPGWPLPREGDLVHIADHDLYVRTVAWYPAGDSETDSSDPFVYVVLGPARR